MEAPETSGAASPADAELSFAHLTDLHLTSLADARLGELLNKRLLGYLSWRRRRRVEHQPAVLAALVNDLRAQRADHVAITGDLTHVGLPGECRAARSWLDAAGAADWITLIPGNHERYVDAPWDETVGQFTPYMSADADQQQAAARDGLFPVLRRRGPVAFIGTCSAWPTPPFLATGWLGAPQRQRLREVLEATAAQGLFRVLLIHHPPLPGSYKWRKRLTDGAATARLLQETGVELVLHGHTHRLCLHHLATRTGTAPVIGLPSASSASTERDRVARYFLYRVRPGGHGWQCEFASRIYEHDRGVFVAETDWRDITALTNAGIPKPFQLS